MTSGVTREEHDNSNGWNELEVDSWTLGSVLSGLEQALPEISVWELVSIMIKYGWW